MQLSFHQSLFQLWLLTFLRTLLASVQLLLRLATTTTLIPPPLPDQPEPDGPISPEKPYEDESHRRQKTRELPSKPLGYLTCVFYERFRALCSRPSLALQPDEVFSPSAKQGRVKGRTPFESTASTTLELNADLRLLLLSKQFVLDRTLLKDAISTLQHAHAVLAWLIYFYLDSRAPPPHQDIVVPDSIARRLFRVFRRLRSAPLLAYTNIENFTSEDNTSFAVNSITSDLTEKTPNLSELPWGASTQSQWPAPVPQTPGAGALHETYFIPANSSLLGCIEDPTGRPICTGGYSDVWRCNIRFLRPSEAFPTEVAVKVLRSVWMSNRNEADANERQLRRFKQEIITWISLPKHPNIVPLIGWTLTPNLSFISPWYQEGNLYRHLKNLSDTRRIKILLGIAKGLECLHSRNPPVAHGDLKPENILISDQGEPLLADFGLSTILGEERMYTSSHRVGGSFPWMSPEQMMEPSRSCQSDIYSFGSLAFTVMTGKLPHAGLTDGQIALKVCSSSDPKDPVEDWDDYPQLRGPIEELLKDCWSRRPDTRPFMPAIVRRLMDLLEASQPQ